MKTPDFAALNNAIARQSAQAQRFAAETKRFRLAYHDAMNDIASRRVLQAMFPPA